MRRPRFEARDPRESRPGREGETRRDAREEMQLHLPEDRRGAARRILPRWYTAIRESDVSTKQCATFEKTRGAERENDIPIEMTLSASSSSPRPPRRLTDALP